MIFSRRKPPSSDGTRGAGLLDLLLPPQCLCCDASVEAQGQLCGGCFSHTDFITGPACERCGVPFAAMESHITGSICPACAADPPLYGRARAALRYSALGRQLILPFKHADRPELAVALAPHMMRAGAVLLNDADTLIPVPLHRRRLLHRRYNQAALLAQELSRLTGVAPRLNTLLRHRATVSLGEKSAVERALVVQDAFAMRRRSVGGILGMRVLLVDDVMTSGATANACASTLLAAGARNVDVLVAARVPDPRFD